MPATRARHLYGVVPALIAMAGVEGLPDDVAFVPYQRVAALTRPPPTEPARQLRGYLLEYAEILDRVAEAGPVLPVRFGTVLSSESDMERDVLAPSHDSFVRALAALTGKTQFTVRVRYLGDSVIREVLAERPEAAQLHQRLQGHQPGLRAGGGADPARVRLGELVARAVGAKRRADSELLVQRLREHAVAIAVQPAAALDGERVADVACLVEQPRRAGLEAAMTDLARRWQGRARLRLLGPMAPYHFAADFVSGDLVVVGDTAVRDPVAGSSGRG